MKRRIFSISILIAAALALVSCGRADSYAVSDAYAKDDSYAVREHYAKNDSYAKRAEYGRAASSASGEADSISNSTKADSSSASGEVLSAVSEDAEKKDGPRPVVSEYKETRPRKPKYINVVMIGDMLLHDEVQWSAKDDYGNYDFNFLFSGTGDRIKNADIAIVNQEVILGGTELGVSGYPSFNAPYEVADALDNTGFDIICHATNHALDRRGVGIINCMTNWRNNHPAVLVAGIHSDAAEQDYFPIIEREGIRIALLNYTYGTNGITPDYDMPWSVEYLDRASVKADLDRAEAIADFTIVVPHWGTEYNHGVDAAQREWAQFFADNGADLIIGAHPHVIEPLETVVNNEGAAVPVYYSLGNFVCWTAHIGAGKSDRMVGGMADVTIAVETENDGTKKASVASYTVHPVITYLEWGHEAVAVHFLSDYDEEKAGRNVAQYKDRNFTYSFCVDLCNRVWGGQWTE